ncbi:unnamed protein product [Absidia cylindrospora]
MTSSNKKRRLEKHTPRVAAEQDSSQANHNGQRMDDPQYGECKPDTYIKPELVNHEEDENQANNSDDNDPLRLYGRQLLDKESSTVKLTDNGCIIIRPASRVMPSGLASLLVQHIHGRRALFHFALVNKQCYAAANPLLWKSLKIQTKSSLEHKLVSLPHSRQPLGQYIRKLDISQMTCDSDQLIHLMRHTSTLKKLTMTNVILVTMTAAPDEWIQYSSPQCRKLTSLALTRCDVSKPFIQAIGRHCPKLRKMTLIDCQNISSDSLQAFMDCPVKRLHITNRSTNVSTKSDLALTLMQFDRLTHLTIDFRDFRFVKYLMISSSPIATTTTIATPWPHLVQLTIGQCSHIGNQTLTNFIKSHNCLHTLCLTGVSQFGNTTLYAMANFLPRLTHLMVAQNRHITEQGVRRLVRASHRLVYAEFINCGQLLKGAHTLPDYFYYDDRRVIFGDKKRCFDDHDD